MNKNSIPKEIVIQSVEDNQAYTVFTASETWTIYFGGHTISFEWKELAFEKQFETCLKLFIIYRLQNRSVATVCYGDFRFLIQLKKHKISFPLSTIKILKFFNEIKNIRVISIFKSFYNWALKRDLEGFEKKTMLRINEYKITKRKPYESIFLNQNFLENTELKRIKLKIKKFNEFTDFVKFRDHIILYISYELAPRRSQLFLLNSDDFKIINGPTPNIKYYSINLPMSKKRISMKVEKRSRGISKNLGSQIEKLLTFYPLATNIRVPMFCDEFGKRLKIDSFSRIIKNTLGEINVKKTITDMRHHLAQSLADQGASAEIIAEILGHNSTMPARAYIAATPKIAEIKAAALGKNKKYNEIINMISTGKIIQKNQTTNKERWVQGMVGDQYIGGIGSCGLPSDTSCPKNPVYACYTCLKFHPFKNGNHEKVKNGLQNQAQFHIDIAEKGLDIEHNRPVTQLEETIAAVDHVLFRIKKESDGK